MIEHKTALEVQRQWVTKDNEAFARLSENEDGRAFLCRLIAECGVFERNLESDAARMAFNEGRRSVGLWVLELLETAKPGSSGALLQRTISPSACSRISSTSRASGFRTYCGV